MNMQGYYPSWLNAAYYQNIPHNEVNWAQLAQQWMAMRDQNHQHQPQEGPVAIPYNPPGQSSQNQQYQHQQSSPQFHHQPSPADHSASFRQQTTPVVESASPIQPQTPDLMTRAQSSPIHPDAAPPRQFFGRRPSENFPLFPASKIHEENANMAAMMGGPMHPGLLPTPPYHRPMFPSPMAAASAYDYGNYGPMGAAGPRPLFGRPMPPRMRMPPPPPEFYAAAAARKNEFESLGAAFANQYSTNFEEEEFYTHQDMDYRKWKPPLFAEQDQEEYYDDSGFSGAVFGASGLDVQQRKNLPAWIREGLEKMEREKAKQKEKEEQEKLMKEQEELKKSKKRKSRFESDSEDEERESDGEEDHQKMDIEEISNRRDDSFILLSTENDNEDDEEELTAEEQKAELMNKLRVWLTEILMTVTTSEIEKIVQETLKSKKSTSYKSKRAQPQVLAQSSAALATIIGLGSDQDSASEDDERSDDQSENEDASASSATSTNRSIDSPVAADFPANQSLDSDINADDSQAEGRDDFFKRPMLPPPGVSKRKVTATIGGVTPASIIERITQTAQKELQQSQLPPTSGGGRDTENGAKDGIKILSDGLAGKQIDNKKLTDIKSDSLKKSSSSSDSKRHRSHSKSLNSSSSKSKSSSHETSRSSSKDEKSSSSSKSESKSSSSSKSKDKEKSSSKSDKKSSSHESKEKSSSSSKSKSERDGKRKKSRSKSRDQKSKYRSRSRSPLRYSSSTSNKSRSRSKSRESKSKSSKNRRRSKSKSKNRSIKTDSSTKI